MMVRNDSFVSMYKVFAFAIISSLFFVGCGAANESEGIDQNESVVTGQEEVTQEKVNVNEEEAYPEQISDNGNNSDSAYPVENSSDNEEVSYPIEKPDSVNIVTDPYPAPGDEDGVLLAINQPINAGDTMIHGVGPAGLPIIILNITFVGEQLGAGVIDEDGTFSIPVVPIPEGVRIGVTADSDVTDSLEVEILPGEGEISVPRVGYFYDSVVIPSDG